MKRKKLWLSLLLAVALLGAWFEPTRCVRGVLQGEPFYDGRPASWWAEQWEPWCVWACVRGDRKTQFPDFDELENDPSDKLAFGTMSRSTLWDQAKETFHRTFVNRGMPKRPMTASSTLLSPPLLAGDDPAVLPVLQSLVNHASPKVRVFAHFGIEKLRDAEAKPVARQPAT